MTEIWVFGRFELGRLLRSWRFLLITVGFPVVFYMLFITDHRPGKLVDGTITWRVYLMVAMGSFGALVAALTAAGARLSAERASGWARQLRVTPLPEWAYAVTKVAASMLVILPLLGLVDVVGWLGGGVQLPVGTWLELTALMWVCAVPFALLGVLIGFSVNSETAFPVVTALMFVLGYFGGLFNPVSDMPGPLQAAARVLPTFHQDSVGVALLQGHGLGLQHFLVLGGYTAALTVAIHLRHRHEELRGAA